MRLLLELKSVAILSSNQTSVRPMLFHLVCNNSITTLSKLICRFTLLRHTFGLTCCIERLLILLYQGLFLVRPQIRNACELASVSRSTVRGSLIAEQTVAYFSDVLLFDCTVAVCGAL